MSNVKHPELMNAADVASRFPETFSVPTKEQFIEAFAVQAGSTTPFKPVYFEVCCGNERFWVQATDIMPDGEIIGMIDGELVNTDAHGLMEGMFISFREENIYEIQY